MISVMIIGEVDLVRGALAAVLAHEADLDVAPALPLWEGGLATVDAHRPAVVIVDLDQYGAEGLALVGRFAAELPECRVLALTRRQTAATLPAVLAAGAWGVASPDASPGQLASWIRLLAAGERVIDPELATAALAPVDNPLTERERAVLRLAGQGRRSGEIAAELFLAPGTVRNYLSAATRKAGARNRLEAVRRAREAGWL